VGIAVKANARTAVLVKVSAPVVIAAKAKLAK